MKKLIGAVGAISASLVVAAAPSAAQELGPSVTCKGEQATIVGTPDEDVLEGTPGSDVIVGLGKPDVIRSRGGDDLVCAGHGNDRLFGASGSDRLFGRGEDDSIEGGAGSDRLVGGTSLDVLQGERGARDVCLGGRPVTDPGAYRDRADYRTCEQVRGADRLIQR